MSHDNARTELFEGYMTRKYVSHPQMDISTGGSSLRKSKWSNSAQNGVTGTKRSTSRTPDSRPVGTEKNNQREESHRTATARAGSAVDREEGSSLLGQCRGRTIYNAMTTSPGPFGDILDATLSNGEVDPTLMELARIIKEERLREAKWRAFVYGEGPEHWAYPGSFGQASTQGLLPPTPSASFTLDPNQMLWVPIEDLEAKLDETFHQYFNVDEYMA